MGFVDSPLVSTRGQWFSIDALNRRGRIFRTIRMKDDVAEPHWASRCRLTATRKHRKPGSV